MKPSEPRAMRGSVISSPPVVFQQKASGVSEINTLLPGGGSQWYCFPTILCCCVFCFQLNHIVTESWIQHSIYRVFLMILLFLEFMKSHTSIVKTRSLHCSRETHEAISFHSKPFQQPSTPAVTKQLFFFCFLTSQNDAGWLMMSHQNLRELFSPSANMEPIEGAVVQIAWQWKCWSWSSAISSHGGEAVVRFKHIKQNLSVATCSKKKNHIIYFLF